MTVSSAIEMRLRGRAALEVAPPVYTWGATEVAIVVLHRVVYAAATAVAYEALGCACLSGR